MRPILLLVLALSLLITSPMRGHARDSQLLGADWKFKLGENTGAERADFDVRGWETVSLPHNWGWQEAQEGKPYYRGPGWYRRELDIAPQTGKRVFLRFEAEIGRAHV